MVTDNTIREKREMLSRRRYIGVVGAAGLSGVAGCSGSQDDGGQNDNGGGDTQTTDGAKTSNVSLTVNLITDSTNPKQKEVLRNAFDDWAKTTSANVKREFQFVSFQDALKRLNTTMAAGNPPNLIFLDMSAAARWRNELADLSNLRESLGVSSDLTTKNNEGNAVFIPHDFGAAYPWYRTDVLEEAGINAPDRVEDAWTWDEYRTKMGELKNHLSDSKMKPDTLIANPSLWLTSWIGDTDLSTVGAEIVKREGGQTKVTIDKGQNRSRAIEALNFRKKCFESGFYPDTVSWDVDDQYSALGNGLVAGAPYGARMLNNLREQSPDVASKISPAVMPVHPNQKSGKSEYKQNMAAAGFFIPKQVEHKDILKSFIKHYFASDWYIESLLAVPLHKVPLRPEILEQEKYTQNEVVQANPEVLDFLKNFIYEYGQLAVNKTNPATPYYRDWAEWANETPLPTMFASAWLGRKEPGQAVDDVAKHLRSTQSDYTEE